MSIIGNMAGCYSPMGKTFVIIDENGNEITGVVTEQEQIFTATDNDVREGMVYAGDSGVSTGTKNIPAYHTTEGIKIITSGETFSITLNDVSNLNRYDYTKLQAIICPYNTSLSTSVSAEQVVIEDKVYTVQTTVAIADITKNESSKSIELGITNNSSKKYIIRYFTYKEIY